MSEISDRRLALFPVLAQMSQVGHIGRTALMKYLYFLQTLRDVPLGYRFTLYSYGPFDSEVLSDLTSAETLGLVESQTVMYPGGFGYQIRPGDKISWIKKRASAFLKEHKPDIKWVSKMFGSMNASELELVSTIIYINREITRKGKRCTMEQLANSVFEVKPHFPKNRILSLAEDLSSKHLIKATRTPA